MKPKIRVCFTLAGDEFSKAEIEEKLGLAPSFFRTKEDWPDGYIPQTVWGLETGYAESMSAAQQLEEMIEKLKGREDAIHQLCEELGLTPGFFVSIDADVGYFPEVSLGKETVAFMEKIGADVDFDFYADWRVGAVGK